MLTSRADQLRARIDDLVDRKRLRNYVQPFRTRAEALQAPADRLGRLMRVLTAFRARGIRVPLDADMAAALREHVRTLRERYTADRASIVSPDGELRFAFWQPLEAYPDQVEAALMAAWTAHVEAQLPPHQPGLLEVMARVPGFGAQVATIARFYADAATLARTLPDDESFTALDGIAAGLQRAWSELSGPGIPDEVLTFLRAATTGGAPRVNFTAAVERWLVEHGLMANVRIALVAVRT